jgi:hypothetical protein
MFKVFLLAADIAQLINGETGNPRVAAPIDRPGRTAATGSPLAITVLAVLPAQLTLCPIASPSPEDLRPLLRLTRTVPVLRQ